LKRAPKINLEQFATEEFKRGGIPCWVCSLPKPIREEIEAARKKDPLKFNNRILTAYLVKQGYNATRNKICKHFLNHVL